MYQKSPCDLPFIDVVKDYPPFTITNKVGDNHNNVPTRLGEYTFNKIWNGAAAFTNGNYIILYGGTGYGWQWATDESQLAANGPALSEVANGCASLCKVLAIPTVDSLVRRLEQRSITLWGSKVSPL